MNEEIKKHLIAYCESKGYGTTDKDLTEVLTESNSIFSEITGSHRWYDDEFRVVEINGMLIGFYDYHITGDNSREDMDLFIDESRITRVEKKQKLVDHYEPIQN